MREGGKLNLFFQGLLAWTAPGCFDASITEYHYNIIKSTTLIGGLLRPIETFVKQKASLNKLWQYRIFLKLD